MQLNLVLPKFGSLGLLLFLVFFFIVAPFFSAGEFARLVLDLSLISLLILSVYLCSDNKRNFYIAGFLALPTVFRLFNPTFEITEITLSFNATFLLFVIYILLRKLFQTKHVTMDVIYASITIYLLIGVFWGICFMLLESLSPGSFLLPGTVTYHTTYPEFGQDMIYFSFVTLATLGYGDIVPLSQPAKSFATLEAVMGPLYLAVLVSRLVGMHITQEKS